MHASTAPQKGTSPHIPVKCGLVSVEGIDYERVHSSTRQIIHALFSQRTRGYTYFVRLLNKAIIQQYTLPGQSEDLKEDVAVVTVANGYIELSQLLGISYDRTHMYTLVFRALGLLYLETQGKQMTIIIPLGVYRPPARLGEILRQLLIHYSDRRSHLLSCVKSIIERIPSLIPIEQEVSEQPCQDEVLTRVQRGLAAKGVVDPDGQIAMSVLIEIAPLIATCAEIPTAQHEQRIAEYLPKYYRKAKPSCRQESPQRENQDQAIAATQNLPVGLSNNEQAKRTAARATTTSRTMFVTTAQGRFDPKNLSHGTQVDGEAREVVEACGRLDSENLPANPQTEASLQNVPVSVEANLPIRVDSGQISFFTNGIGIGNNSIRKYIKNISDPDPDLQVPHSEIEKHTPHVSPPIAHPTIRQHALALAKLIEGSEENIGAYVQLCRKYDLQAIKAGVIATLLRKHYPEGKGALKRPGGYYTRQVQRFQAALPEQMAELLEIYSQASYEEIEAALEKQAQAQAVHQRPGVFGPSLATSRIRPGQPMDEGMATKLAERIAAEDPDVQVKGICKMRDGMYAVKVYIDPVEHDYCTIEEWNIYHAQMQAIEQEASR